jgi:dienelactone hydrolase
VTARASVALAALALAGAAPPTVHERVLRFVDHARIAHFQTGASGPRVLVTDVRYPERGHPPYPLVVFAHGFALTPATYGSLLDTWARAGYVVAAPAFPVERAGAPGGPSESDLPNEPGDISFVISQLRAPRSPVRDLIDPSRIAVAGQSDGAVAAFSAAYDRRYRDPRIDAALVMSGGPLAGYLPAAGRAPQLLAVQGTQDPLNPPGVTTGYFRVMRRPKFLLLLQGASHLPPYTSDDRWARVVRATTTAFLNHALRGAPLRPLLAAGGVPGVSSLTASP